MCVCVCLRACVWCSMMDWPVVVLGDQGGLTPEDGSIDGQINEPINQ